MIKTKTPRHWGGGIRQVSPPMLTSRLSNKRGGRTNGWKDYSRSRRNCERFWICENVRTANVPRNKYNIHHIYGFYSKNGMYNYICNWFFWFCYKKSTSRLYSNRQFYCSNQYKVVRTRCKHPHSRNSNYGNSPRLTLKGVA